MAESRNEAILENILGADNALLEPQSNIEKILYNILGHEVAIDRIQSRNEALLMQILEQGGSGSASLGTKTITENGTYSASADELDGYSEVTVNVAAVADDSFAKIIDRSVVNVVIPEGVNRIGYGAFGNCTALITVTIPYGIEFIDQSAFSGCTALKDVIFPSSLKQIGTQAFSSCKGLKNLVFPDSLNFIGQSAFTSCSNLETVYIGPNLASIPTSCFYGCSKLNSITINRTTPPNLSSSSLSGIPETAIFYVPAEAVDAYKSANRWSARADYIQAIPE